MFKTCKVRLVKIPNQYIPDNSVQSGFNPIHYNRLYFGKKAFIVTYHRKPYIGEKYYNESNGDIIIFDEKHDDVDAFREIIIASSYDPVCMVRIPLLAEEYFCEKSKQLFEIDVMFNDLSCLCNNSVKEICEYHIFNSCRRPLITNGLYGKFPKFNDKDEIEIDYFKLLMV